MRIQKTRNLSTRSRFGLCKGTNQIPKVVLRAVWGLACLPLWAPLGDQLFAQGPTDSSSHPNIVASTDFTDLAVKFAEVKDASQLPSGMLVPILQPEPIDDGKISADIVGGAIGAKIFGPAYSSPPAAWFIGPQGFGLLVADRPAVAISFRLFALQDGNPKTVGDIELTFRDVRGNTISSLTIGEDMFVENGQSLSFKFRRPFRSMTIETLDTGPVVTIDDLQVEMIFGRR